MDIYLDNAASTKTDPKVVRIYTKAMAEVYGNPTNFKNSYGRAAKMALEQARFQMGQLLGVNPNGFIFTSGATEANNLALRGAACLQKGNCSVIISSIEHSCVLESAKLLKQRGIDVRLLPTNSNGTVNLSLLEKMILKRPRAKLISIMLVNNETGVIQPLEEAIKIARKHGVLIHTDAVQAIGKMPLGVLKHVDMFSISGHKFHAPKGIGALWMRPGLKISPLLVGGGQEFGARSGTTPVPLIMAMTKAVELAVSNNRWLIPIGEALRNLEQDIIRLFPGVKINGVEARRIPNISSISFPYTESIIDLLGGIAASSGSACNCPKVKQASQVLLNMGLSQNMATNTVRLSAGRFNDINDIKAAQQKLIKILRRITSS
jgi:cysteine desulfurase